MNEDEIFEWLEWQSWMPRDDNSIPDDIQPGVVVEAELSARIGHPSWPEWRDQYVFTVINGDSWRMKPVASRNVDCAFVDRYRVLRQRRINTETRAVEKLVEA